MSRIERRFAALREEGRAGLVTYLTAGDPDPDTSPGKPDLKGGRGVKKQDRPKQQDRPRSNQVTDQPHETTAVPTTAAATAPPVPAAPIAIEDQRITIDDFMKVDLRVAKVIAAEKVANSRKLMKLHIDVGTEHRTLVAGIADAYEPEQLIGRTIGVVFNLKPAKLMGIESNGMVLAASPEGGKPTLVSFDSDVPPGSRIR